jgi:hypothetical protein
MNINYLIELLTNRLNSLILAKDHAFSAGDLEGINNIDTEILGVQNTLSQLNILKEVNDEAKLTGSSFESLLVNKANTMQNAIFSENGNTSIILGYDISTYATDPQHEQKITNILSTMGSMDTIDAINQYIQFQNPGSPITGDMIIIPCQKYNVDTRLVVAMLSLESGFGTLGVGARTNNPGNVGNTDSGATRTYASWADGVIAVVQWLNRHRVGTSQLPEAETLIFQDNPPQEPVPEIIPETPVVPEATSTTTEEIINTPITETPTTTEEIQVNQETNTSSSTESVQ